MRYLLISLFLSLFVSASFQSSGQSTKVKNESQKAWVEKFNFDHKAAPAPGQESSYYYLLLDYQENVSIQESFVHTVYKILTNEGLQQMSDLSIEFDPLYQNLIMHAVSIHRDGQIINQLPKEIKTLQREQSMDRFLYDGSLTAIINLTDMRVGDIVEYSFTRKGYNPVFGQHFSKWIDLNYSMAIEKYVERLIVPASLDLSFNYLNTTRKPEIKKEQDHISYTWIQNKVVGVIRDNNEPNWFYPYAAVQVSSFKNWGEVARWASNRYAVSERDKQEVLQEFVPKFKSSDPEEYALEVIHFVQDEIRYLGFESGLNSHKPHSPTQVYTQRFGDCKDKSLLLTALLNAKGIESYPVLVNTFYGSKLSDQLPLIGSFDHCVVQLVLDGKSYYIDPTISSQGGKLDHYYFPAYGKGLVVNPNTTDLVELPDPALSSIHEVQTFDLATIGGEAMLRMETTYKGGEADSQRSYYANNSIESIQKGYLNYYGNLYPDIQKFETIQIDDNRKENIFRVKEKYKIPTFWIPYKDQEGVISCEFYALPLESYFNVSKSSSRTAPYRLTYPLNFSEEIHVMLPEEWTINSDQSKIESEYYTYDHQVIYDDKFLSLLTNYSTKSESIPVDKFGKFVEDHRKMMVNLSYVLTYDKTLITTVSNKTPGALVTTLSLVMGIILVFWLYFRYDPTPQYPAAWATPIGGWLILVAIGICFSPFRLLYDFFSNDALLSGEGWLAMWHTKSYGFFVFVLLEHIYNVVYLLFTILLIVLFFQQRSSLPRLISIFYGCTFAVTLLDNVLVLQMDSDTEIAFNDIARSLIAAAIWIPYFHMSQRVKRTFVNVREGGNGNDNIVAELS